MMIMEEADFKSLQPPLLQLKNIYHDAQNRPLRPLKNQKRAPFIYRKNKFAYEFRKNNLLFINSLYFFNYNF